MLPKTIKSTVVFESDKIKSQLVTKDNNDKITDAGKKAIESHTLRVEFDFDKVTDEEIVNFLTSTTSAMKMFQNNVLKHWDEKAIVENCAKGVYRLKVRDLLDNREAKQITDDEKRRRFLKKEIEKGKSKEEIKKELEAILANM